MGKTNDIYKLLKQRDDEFGALKKKLYETEEKLRKTENKLMKTEEKLKKTEEKFMETISELSDSKENLKASRKLVPKLWRVIEKQKNSKDKLKISNSQLKSEMEKAEKAASCVENNLKKKSEGLKHELKIVKQIVKENQVKLNRISKVIRNGEDETGSAVTSGFFSGYHAPAETSRFKSDPGNSLRNQFSDDGGFSNGVKEFLCLY